MCTKGSHYLCVFVINKLLQLRVVFLLSDVFFSFHSFSVSGSVKEGDSHFTVVVDSFIGKLMKVKVRLSLTIVLC